MTKKEEVIGVKLIRLQIKDKTIDLTEDQARALKNTLESLFGTCKWTYWSYPHIYVGQDTGTYTSPTITWCDTTSAVAT